MQVGVCVYEVEEYCVVFSSLLRSWKYIAFNLYVDRLDK